MISGIAFVVGVFLYYVAAPWNLIGRTDPVGGEAGYEQVAARAQEQLQKTGATWIATTDYRTYAMLRWHFNGRVPVVQINERGRFQGFRDPGMDRIRDHTGLYVAREPDNIARRCGIDITAAREPLERVERGWRGIVMDTYALEKLTGWTPDLVAAAGLAAVPLAGAGDADRAAGYGVGLAPCPLGEQSQPKARLRALPPRKKYFCRSNPLPKRAL